MRYVVVGATGPVGVAIVRSLVEDNQDVTVLSRRPDRARTSLPAGTTVVPWSATRPEEVIDAIRSADAVINLAGASIGSRPWTSRRKREILESRVAATTALVEAMASLAPAERPSVLVNASGIDYYGDRPDGVATESSPRGETFLADVTAEWERAASAAEGLGIRLACVRTAVVVARDAPAFRLLCLPIRLFVGGPLGSGTQLFTWIHIDDLVGLYRLAATDPSIVGPVNAVAPDVRTQGETARVIGEILHRPTWLRLPAGILRIVMREQADLLLHGRRAEPRVALDHGYRFRFATMDAAFADALGRPGTAAAVSMASPFERDILEDEPAMLPDAFRRQFLGSPDDERETFLSGTMDTVWRRHAWLWPMFSILARANTLFPETGRDIPAQMTVRNHRTEDGRPWQTWERIFDFGHVRRRFDARVTFDARSGQVLEHTGPGGRLETHWRIERDGGRMLIEALALFVRIGRLRVRLPRLFSVAVRAVQTIDPAAPDQIHIDLSLRNPLLGPVFGYEGSFRVERRPKT
jgi:uncharacterized protein (TIGR01777 family)